MPMPTIQEQTTPARQPLGHKTAQCLDTVIFQRVILEMNTVYMCSPKGNWPKMGDLTLAITYYKYFLNTRN